MDADNHSDCSPLTIAADDDFVVVVVVVVNDDDYLSYGAEEEDVVVVVDVDDDDGGGGVAVVADIDIAVEFLVRVDTVARTGVVWWRFEWAQFAVVVFHLDEIV